VLDRVRVARRGVIGIQPELLPGPALAQQVPAAVQLDVYLAQPLAVYRERARVGAVRLLAPAQPNTTQMTAGNSSPLNDGASAVVLASAQAAEELGVEPLARVVASATHALDPQVMGIAPAFAIPRALQRAGLAPEQIDVWEVHEAYASVALAILRELPNQLDGFEVPDERLNPNGGAVAIGHPFGSSGTRYVLTLATELRRREARYGVLGVCVGSGQGVALVLENPSV